jgi:hypothetical protein
MATGIQNAVVSEAVKLVDAVQSRTTVRFAGSSAMQAIEGTQPIFVRFRRSPGLYKQSSMTEVHQLIRNTRSPGRKRPSRKW